MNIPRYDFSTSESLLEYEFESEGPNGKIKKLAIFSPQNINGITYFNLAFGDLDVETGKIDDSTITDNKDRQQVLATVASTVLELTSHFPDLMVYVEGSTSSRTRLYQMEISAHWAEIDKSLYIFGFRNGEWVSFRKNINFDAFIALRKPKM